MKLEPGINRQIIEQISELKHDPDWMREFRLNCLEIFDELNYPDWGPDISGLDLNNISSYIKPSTRMVASWEEVPDEISKTFEDLGIPEGEREGLAGVGAQFDSELVYHNVKQAVSEQGVIYSGIEEALTGDYADLVHDHFMKLITPHDHKFAALHGAAWSGGSFVYVPKNTSVTLPLQSYFRFNAPGAGQFEHTLIIVDEGGELEFIEGCSAPKYNIANLHAGCVEIFVGKNAYVKYSTVENWSKNMYNLNSKRALVEEGGKIEWVTGSFGSRVSMLYPMAILNGRGAQMEYTGVSLAGHNQDLDTGVKVLHVAPDTKSFMNSKSLAKDGGKNTFRSLVKILPSAKHASSFTDCQSLMLDSKSRTDTIPVFDIRRADADIAHEASVGKINDEAVSYLQTRGLSETEARALIVRGFTKDISKELPLEYALEMNNLIKLEMSENL